MATQKFIVTDGPSKLALMLALFDPYPNGEVRRKLKFVAEPEPDSDHALGAYIKLRRETQPGVLIIYDLNSGLFNFELIIAGVDRVDDGDEWDIAGYLISINSSLEPTEDEDGSIEIRFSTRTREGSFYMSTPDEPDTEDWPLVKRMPSSRCWTCDWCKKTFFENEVQPRQTFDGGTICLECFERDDEGPQIARYGIGEYEARNEPERVVDADGKVDYE